MERDYKIFAVDFDGVITTRDEFPDIVEVNAAVISQCKSLQDQGHKLILWTSRNGAPLNRALDKLKEYGLEFDAVNENLPNIVDQFEGFESRKIFADYYIDDKNLSIDEFLNI